MTELPAPGDLFASRYRIKRLLGKGGFGAVFEARDTQLDRDIALKVLMHATDAQSLARFLREARASAAITSDQVATVFEVGSTGDGPFIVMELLRGSDLQDQLDERTKLPVDEAVDHVLQAALGIAHAHARGIVHRDLKPRNLFLAHRDDGTRVVKVLDFGIAKQTSTDLTQTGTTLGTPRYMAPEQLRSARSVDARTDIWALGVVLYELVSGKPIFDGDTATQLAVSIVVDPHVKLRARDAELPAELEAVIDRCLEKEPDARFADVHALALALRAFASEAGKALVPRIERALGDRSSKPVADTIRASIATDQTVDATPKSRQETRTTVDAPSTVKAGPGARNEPTVEAPARSNRVAIIAVLIAAAAIATAVGFAMRGNGTAPIITAAPDSPPPTPDAATPDSSPDATIIVPADTAIADAQPTRDARAAPVGPSDKEIEDVGNWCLNHRAPLSIIPNNDGPVAVQCGRLALLGCAGITRGCRTRAVTDEERAACRDFQASLRDAGICR